MHTVTVARRRGFTLVELLIALMLFSILGGAILKVLTSQQRSYNSQLARTGLQQNIRIASAILPGEFRELDPVDGDITLMSDTSITVRSMRQFGIVCKEPTLGGVLAGLATTVRGPLYSSSRNFIVGDSVFLWYEGDPKIRTDDSWMMGKVTTVSAGACPTLPAAGNQDVKLLVTMALGAGQVNALGNIPNGAPLRGFESRTYRLYQDTDTRWYLGVRRGAGTTDQLIGPLSGSSGVTFTYRDAAGAVTAVPAAVAQIGITLRAETKNPIYSSGGNLGTASDSVVLAVSVRNSPRF